MTTDAKIGLLLALVFIVAITFVINGLPDFLNKKDKQDVTEAYIRHYSKPDEPGIVDRSSREVAAVLSNKKIVSAADVKPVMEANKIQSTAYQTILPAASEVVRTSVAETPKAAENIAVRQTSPIPSPVSAAAAVQDAAGEQKIEGKIYQVAVGDSLTSIAKDVYGLEAGSKYANIQKIYEANKKSMSSMDDLKVGQKLIIPALSEKEKALVKTGMFEKPGVVASPGESEAAKMSLSSPADKETNNTSALAGEKQKTGLVSASSKQDKPAGVSAPSKESKTYIEYTVKENDTLWKIAAKTLGDGNRYREIIKLNKLINPDNLVAGTKIKLPAK